MFHVEPDRRYSRTATTQNELQLAGGLQGVSDTLKYMVQAVSAYKTNPKIRELSLSLTRNLPQKDYPGEVRALFDYVKNRIRYVRDINGVETLQTPVKTLEYGQGDCDDKSMLLAAMLESLGHKTRFKAIGMRPGVLSHVSVETQLGGQWINLETTEPVQLGWTPPYYVEEMTSDNLGSLFSKVWGAVKGAGRAIDHAVVSKVTTPLSPLLRNKAVQSIVSVTSFFDPTGISQGIKIAGTVANMTASESAARSMHNTLMAQQAGQLAQAQQLAQTRYVMDQSTNQIRQATATDVGQQQFTLDPTSGQLVPANNAQISATQPGLTIGASTPGSYPLPYASAGYPSASPQVVFKSPSGGLTTVNPLANSSQAGISSQKLTWIVAGLGGVGLLLLMRRK